MQQLSQNLKELYVLLLQEGRFLNWSDAVTFEVALNSLIKFLSLFYYQPWNKIVEEPFSSLKKTEKRMIFLEKFFHSFEYSAGGNEKQAVEKSIFYLSAPTPKEKQLLKSIPGEDWNQVINLLETYTFNSVEKFQESTNQEGEITPEFLSFFAEIVINEFEKDFSVSPKVSSRKTKGVYYSPWKIIRELADNLISDDRTQVTVLDPSCGTGSFLLYTTERIYQNQQKYEGNYEDNPSNIVKNFIYGVDKSSSGILVTKLRLLLWILGKDPESNLDTETHIFSNIREGNSLFGFINEKFNPTIDLINYLSQNIQKIGVKSSKLVEMEKYLNKDWVICCDILKSVLTERDFVIRANIDSLMEQVNKDLSKIFNNAYVQFLSTLTNQTMNLKSLYNTKVTQLEFFHWGLMFPEILRQGGFDICLGNPPYGRSILSVTEKNILKASYSSCKGSNAKKISLNAAGAFIERSIKLLKPEGRLAFILPFSILRVEEFERIRDYILEKTVIDEIHDESAAFQTVTLEMCSLILTKQQKNDYPIFIKPRKGLKLVSQVNKSVFMNYKRFMIYYDTNWQIITRNGEFSQIMGDYGVDHRIVKKDLKRNYTPSMEYVVPFLHSGRCVTRYALNPNYFHWSKSNHKNPRFIDYLEKPKLVCTAIGNEFRVAYKPRGIVPGTNVSIMEISNPQHDFFPLMIILNSSLINYLLKRYILNYSHLTVYLHKYYTQLIPIKYPWSYEKEWRIIGTYISLLNQIQQLNLGLSYQKELKFLGEITEHMVYHLYLPEIYTDSKLTLTSILQDSLLEIQFEDCIEALLSPTSDIEEIIKEKNSDVMIAEARILAVISTLKTESILNILSQSKQLREKSGITKKILLDTTPKMIRT